MSEHIELLKQRFLDPKYGARYRETYDTEHSNQYIATQLTVLREMRGLNQTVLGARIGTKQAGISRLEQASHGAWNLKTLRKIAYAMGCRLRVSFETFGSLLDEVGRLDRKSLERVSIDEDPAFGYVPPSVPRVEPLLAGMRDKLRAYLSEASIDVQPLRNWLAGQDLPSDREPSQPYEWVDMALSALEDETSEESRRAVDRFSQCARALLRALLAEGLAAASTERLNLLRLLALRPSRVEYGGSLRDLVSQYDSYCDEAPKALRAERDALRSAFVVNQPRVVSDRGNDFGKALAGLWRRIVFGTPAETGSFGRSLNGTVWDGLRGVIHIVEQEKPASLRSFFLELRTRQPRPWVELESFLREELADQPGLLPILNELDEPKASLAADVPALKPVAKLKEFILQPAFSLGRIELQERLLSLSDLPVSYCQQVAQLICEYRLNPSPMIARVLTVATTLPTSREIGTEVAELMRGPIPYANGSSGELPLLGWQCLAIHQPMDEGKSWDELVSEIASMGRWPVSASMLWLGRAYRRGEQPVEIAAQLKEFALQPDFHALYVKQFHRCAELTSEEHFNVLLAASDAGWSDELSKAYRGALGDWDEDFRALLMEKLEAQKPQGLDEVRGGYRDDAHRNDQHSLNRSDLFEKTKTLAGAIAIGQMTESPLSCR